MARKCNECRHCRCVLQVSRTRTVRVSHCYYCAHPRVSDLPTSVFRNGVDGLIGIGRPSRNNALPIKTHPRWCPNELFQE